MIEHLSQESRGDAVRELVRVTGGTLFLAMPCGRRAGAIDGFFLAIYSLLKIDPPEWMVEHRQMGMPDAAAIRSCLDECSVSYREVSGESSILHPVITLLISMKVLNNCWRRILFRRPGRARFVGRCASLAGLLPYRRLWIVECKQPEGFL
jgi:hypothetical protein